MQDQEHQPKEGTSHSSSNYSKIYREKNKERISASKKKYREVNREVISEKAKSYYSQNEEKLRAYQKEYYAKNRERILERQKSYSRKPEVNAKSVRSRKEKVQCDRCESVVSKSSLTSHKRTKRCARKCAILDEKSMKMQIAYDLAHEALQEYQRRRTL